MICDEMALLCKEKFESLQSSQAELCYRQTKQAKEIKELAIVSARLNERLCALTGAVQLLTKALWGVAASGVGVLLSLIIERIF